MKFKKKKKLFFLHRLKSKHHPLLFRRLAFLWIFLIILEIGCPFFESESFAIELQNDNPTFSGARILTSDSAFPTVSANPKSQNNSLTAYNPAVSGHQFQTEDCDGECLCHITPVNVLAFIMPNDFQHSFVTPVKLKFQPSSDLPPPHQPPQFS